jgi:hypothetical protein
MVIMMNEYIGHESQLYGVEEYRLVGGKGDGMRLLQVRNGLGLELTISPDRAADISRLTYRGINMSYMAPCGYVSPAYYESTGANFLKSFTAGFLTTCGLQAVGSPCTDEGEELPLHGSIGNTPAEQVYWRKEEDELVIHAQVNDEGLFARKLRLVREIRVSLQKNEFTIKDIVENRGAERTPVEILYHMNMGYPLLDEDSIVKISSDKVIPRNEHAAADLENWMHMEKPQKQYEERCYYHECKDVGIASIYQPKLKAGLLIHFDPKQLDCFTEWKMMGYRDYVLGLEPGNCYPDGRDVMRKAGKLKFAEPEESLEYSLRIKMMD